MTPPLPRLPLLDATRLPSHRPAPARIALPTGRRAPATAGAVTARELRELALAAGAADVGLVRVSRSDLDALRPDIEALLPSARTLVAFVVTMHKDNVRVPARSVANEEFHQTIDEANEVARAIARALAERGYRAVNPPGGFPMEMDRFPGKVWTLSLKPIAVAAGLGQMGIHRNVIHPRFGSFILLGVVLTDAELADEEDIPVEMNPCLGCRLCVAACPVGAIASDGGFDFAACTTHNYREFLGGFSDWVETVTEAKGPADYRAAVAPSETASVWQSLSFGANYKAAYCIAVCPAGEDVIGPYLASRPRHMAEVVKPLTGKSEPVYVVAGSDAEAHVRSRFPHKQVRPVGNGLVPTSVEQFVAAAPLVFSRTAAREVKLRIHFSFRGNSSLEVTFAIDHGTLAIEAGHVGDADLAVDVDASTWLGIVLGDRSPVWAVLTRRLKVRGPTRLLATFRACFPR